MHYSRVPDRLFFFCAWMGKKWSGKHSIALFWQSKDSGDLLERILVVSKGLLIGVDRPSPYNRWRKKCEWLAVLWVRSIYTNLQAFAYNQKPLKRTP